MLHATGILYMTNQTFQNLKQKYEADAKGRKKNVLTYSSHDFVVLTSMYGSLTT